MKVRRVVPDHHARGGHGSSNLIDHIAGVAARVLQVRLTYLETAVSRHVNVCDRHPREEDGEDSLFAPENVGGRPPCCHTAQLDLLARSDLETMFVISWLQVNIKTLKHQTKTFC